MSDAKHTAGPWHTTNKHPRHISDKRGFKIAKCLIKTRGANFEMKVSEAEANAHLTAAAPDLLEALERSVALVDSATIHVRPSEREELIGALCNWNAVIAKARGQS